MSGPDVRFGLEILVDSVPESRRVALRSLRFDGALLDRGLVIFFPRPESFTGEDVAELHVHGGRAVIAAVLSALGSIRGFRPAEPGEFTRRAFLNRKLDLAQVEGLADLVQAETEAQRRQALRQSDGEISRIVEGWRERLVRARALLEAELDFPDEDDIPGSISEIAWADVARMSGEIGEALHDGHRGERLRDGAEVVLLGPPNAGKSSLLNALARRDVAIVAPEPGTTRDLIEVHLDLGGYPVTLVDTAGLREAANGVETEGIRRARARAGRADLVLWLCDLTGPRQPPPVVKGPLLRLGTKLDLIDSDEERSRARAEFDLMLSARDGTGIEALLGRLTDFVAREFGPGEASLITRIRHRNALTACHAAMDAALRHPELPLELRAEELRRAGDALGRISGRVEVDDLLDVIFGDFCIGK